VVRSKYHSQGETTTSELPLVCQYQDWTPKEKLQNFYQKTELSVVPEPVIVVEIREEIKMFLEAN
jgi:hypothetical protein